MEAGDLFEAQRAVPNIPPKSNRKWKPCFSKVLYRERNLVERLFNRIKHFRRISTRYDKLALLAASTLHAFSDRTITLHGDSRGICFLLPH